MLIKTNIYKEIEIKRLEDLPKLQILMEENNLKVNKSQIARKLGLSQVKVGNYFSANIFARLSTPLIDQLIFLPFIF